MGHFPEEHNQIPVKVNKFVDEGVAPLVIALNEFDGVMTIDSCEKSVIHGSPFVSFFYGNYSWRTLGAFMTELKKVLDELDLCCGYELSIVWPCSVDGYPHGSLVVGRDCICIIADQLTKSALDVNRRMFELTGDI